MVIIIRYNVPCMNRYRNKIIFILVFLTVIGGGLFFRQAVLSSFLEHYLQKYSRQCFGPTAQLHIETIGMENGSWVIEKPIISSDTTYGMLEESFSAKRIIINYTLNWLEREVNASITVVDPEIHLGQLNIQNLTQIYSSSSNSGAFFTFPEIGLFKLNSEINIDQAILNLPPAPATPDAQHIGFQYHGKMTPDINGRFVAWLQEPYSESNRFELTVTPDQNQNTIHANFHKVDCKLFTATLQTLCPTLADWNATEGFLNGQLQITLPHVGDAFAEGDLSLHQLLFHNSLLQLRGKIPKAHLRLVKQHAAKDQPTITHGAITLLEPASFVFMQAEDPYWEFQNISGAIDLHPSYAAIDFEGLCSHHEQHYPLHISGKLDISSKASGLNLGVHLTSPDNKEIIALLDMQPQDTGGHLAEIKLKNCTHHEFEFMQTLIAPMTAWNHFQMHYGCFDAFVNAHVNGMKISDVKIHHIKADQLKLYVVPWQLSVNIDNISGDCAFDPASGNSLDTLDAKLAIDNGQLKFGETADCWHFNKIHTQLAIQKGILQKSTVTGEYSGLQGGIEIDLTAPEEIISMQFHGAGSELINLIPEHYFKGIQKKFSQDSLSIAAKVNRNPSGVIVDGILTFTNSQKPETIDFTFEIEKSPKQLWGRWPAPPTELSPWQQVGLEAISAMLPALAAPASMLKTYLQKQDLGLAGFTIKNGQFHAHDLPLDKYVSPLIFPKEQLSLSGRGDCHGTFDHKSLSLQYDARDLYLGNDYFSLDAVSLASNQEDARENEINRATMLPATHTIEFDSGAHFGTIPLHNATYFEKNSGLLFTDINAQIKLDQDRLRAEDVETFCNGVYFAGSVGVDFGKGTEGNVEVDILAHTMSGKVSQCQHLLAHFKKPLFFIKGSLDGNIVFREKGGSLHLTMLPEGTQMEAHIQGALTEGMLAYPNVDISLNELNLNFEYDHASSALECSDIQGTLLVGTPNHLEEYTIAAEHIRFNDYANNIAEFDIWIGDKNRDVIRLAGKTQPASQANANSAAYIEFLLDHDLSHFGNVHPKNFELVLKDWSQIEMLDLQFEFQLATLLRDLQRFSRTGLFFLSRSLLKDLNDLKTAEGDFKVDLHYDNNTSLLTYNAESQDLAVGKHKFKKCLLQGKKKDKTWIIDQLQLDDLSFAADLTSSDDHWKINFLGVRYGKSLLLGLEGEYSPQNNTVDADVNLLEAHLAHLGEWPKLQKSLAKYSIKGDIRATGKMRLAWFEGKPGWHLDTLLNTNIRGCELQGTSLRDAENISCHYDSDKGITLRNISTAIKGAKSELAALTIDKIHLGQVDHVISIDGLQFSVPYQNLTWLTSFLEQHGKDELPPAILPLISHSKTSGNLEGSLSLTSSMQHKTLNLSLKDGKYHLGGEEYELSNFSLECNPFTMHISSACNFQNHIYWLSLRSALPALNSGELIISTTQLIKESYPLVVHWQNHPQTGFDIQDAQGYCAGITFNLQRALDTSPDTINLTGEITINSHEASPLLSEETSYALTDWKINGNYQLKGSWNLAKKDLPVWKDKIHFVGTLESHNSELKGYQLETLTAELEYTPPSLHVQNLRINDFAGTLHSKEAEIFKNDQGEWRVSIPLLTVTQFRPSMLREVDNTSELSDSTFIIRQLDLNNFNGDLFNPRSFEGHGVAYCANPPKRDLPNPIWSVPSDMLSSLGLDLSALNPVSGAIHYKIQNKKIYLTKFKDMYSAGKVSKFNLPRGSTNPSYIDFDGNLFIQVRMKQYNLLFKLAELFTVTIEGTLKKPTYNLLKSRNVHDD